MNAKETATVKEAVVLLKRRHNKEENLANCFIKEAIDRMNAVKKLEALLNG